MTLEQLAVKYRTDKAQAPVGKLTPKGYTEHYELLLEDDRNQVLSVLELGIARGASLWMWADYFPHATIVGVDTAAKALDHPRIVTYRGRQQDVPTLTRIIEDQGPFDLIVDDGSHRKDDQIRSIRHLWPAVRSGGIYVVEDLHAPSSHGFVPWLVDTYLEQLWIGRGGDVAAAWFFSRMVALRKA